MWNYCDTISDEFVIGHCGVFCRLLGSKFSYLWGLYLRHFVGLLGVILVTLGGQSGQFGFPFWTLGATLGSILDTLGSFGELLRAIFPTIRGSWEPLELPLGSVGLQRANKEASRCQKGENFRATGVPKVIIF